MASGLGIKIYADGEKEFRSALKDIDLALKENKSALELVASQFDANDKSMLALTSRNDELKKGYELQTDKVNTLGDALKNAESAYQAQIDRVSGLRDALSEAEKAYGAQGDKVVALKQALEDAEKAYGGSSTEVTNLKDALKEAEKAYSDQGKEIGGMKKELDGAEKATNSAQNSTVKWQTELNKAETELNKMGRELDSSNKSLDEASGGFGEAGNEAGDFADEVKNTGDAAKDAEGKFSGFASALSGIGVAIGAAMAAIGTAAIAAGKALYDMASDTSALGDNVDKMSQKLGISREGFQEWGYIMDQNGASIDGFTTGMKTLQTKLVDVANDGEKSQAMFEKLGLSFDDVVNASPEEAMNMVIAALQQMEPGAQKTALAIEAFGKQGMELMPLLNQTAEATDELRQRAHDLGIVMGDELVDASVKFTDAQADLKAAFQGVKNSISAELLPGLAEVTTALANLVSGQEGAAAALTQGMDTLVKGISDATPKIVATISGVVKVFSELAPVVIRALVDGIINSLPDLIEAGVEIIMAIADGVVSALPVLIEKVLSLIPILIESLGKGISSIFPILKPITNFITLLAKELKVIIPIAGTFVAIWKGSELISYIGNLGGMSAALNKVTIALNAGVIAKLKDKAETIAIAALYAKDTLVRAGNAIATWAQTAALDAKNIALGIATGEITLHSIATGIATVATGIFTAAVGLLEKALMALAANPAFLAIAAVAAGLVYMGTVIKGLVNDFQNFTAWLKRESEDQKDLKQSTEELVQANDALKESMADSDDAHRNNAAAIEEETAKIDLLADKIFELAQQEDKSADDKQKLITMVDLLNDSVEGLNLSFDAETGMLSKTTDEVYNLVDAYNEELSVQEARKRAAEIIKEQIELEARLNAVVKQREEWDKALEEGKVKRQAYTDATKKLESQEQSLRLENDNLSESFKKVNTVLANSTKSQNEILDTYKNNIKDIEKSIESLTKASTDMFKRINTESKQSREEMMDNLSANAGAIKDWGVNMARLAEKGLDEGILQVFRDAGMDLAGEVAEWADASKGEIQRLNKQFTTGGTEAADAFAKAMGVETPKVKNAGTNMVNEMASSVQKSQELNTSTAKLIEEAHKAAENKVKSSNFQSVGQMMASGITKGLKDGESSLFRAIEDMAKKAVDAAKKALDIRSPSRKFAAIGENVGLGFEGGILGMQGEINRTVDKVFGDLDRAVNVNIGSGISTVFTQTPGFGNAGFQSQTSGGDTFNINLSVNLDEISDVQKLLQMVGNIKQGRIAMGVRAVG